MTQLLAIAHVIKIIFIVICIITAYYWIKALIAAKRFDSVIDKFGREYRDGFFKIIEKIQTLDDIDDNKKFQYEINNALTLYKLLGCEKPDYVWTPDSISHLAAEAFEIKLLCICDKDIDKDNERGRQIKIILDKDGRIQQAVVPTDMDYHIRKPSAREYDDCCNEFWNTTTYVVKGLCRKEILFAIDHFNQIVRHELLRMISWKVGIETGFKLSVGKNYKFIERYISEDLWEKLLSTYRMDSYENIWEALFLCHQLFRAVSGEVAERLHYAYPEYDRNITKYTRDMYKKYTGKTGCLDSTYAADIEERREQ